MSSTTVAEFANELKKSSDALLEQLKAAGVDKSAPHDTLSDDDKHSLLNYLQSSHGTATAERKKITLVKKSTTEIEQADATGRARTIQVEVRKKRTFIRRDESQDGVGAEGTAETSSQIDHAELARREEEAVRQSELIRRQEEELQQRRREREEQEAAAQAAQVAQAEAEAARVATQKATDAAKQEKQASEAPGQCAGRACPCGDG